MTTGLTYLLVSVILALMMPFLTSGRGHDERGDTETYRYSILFGRLFLVVIVLAGVALAAACISWTPTGKGAAWVLPGFAILGVGLPALGHAYVSSYRVCIDSSRIEVRSVVGRRSVELSAIASIAVRRRRGVDLVLHTRDGRRLASIGGSVQDFDALLATLERRTRSLDVMLYRTAGFGCEEKPNDPHLAWRPSKGPRTLVRDMLAPYAVICVAVGLCIWAANTLH